ncbi:MAG: DNRLRE domain-containing protein, partial [Chloroflexi bacterium]|nr:DNRLRE domain-containing protein [Chloroflexota bacterium]
NWLVMTAGQDAHIYSWFPYRNFSLDAKLLVSGPDIAHGLMLFEAPPLPMGATIQQAILRVRLLTPANLDGVVLEVYPLLRAWTPSQTTWYQAQNGAMWQTPGAAGPNDRGDLIAVADAVDADGFIRIDVTPLVQGWVNDPFNNYGLLLALRSEQSASIGLASMNYSLPDWRPRLEITLPANSRKSDGFRRANVFAANNGR